MSRLACLALAATLAAATPANAAGIIFDVPGSNGVGFYWVVNLPAGDYAMSFIGTQQGGAFDAYHAWYYGEDTQGCNQTGSGCTKGWLTNIVIDWAPFIDGESGNLTFINSRHPDGEAFATADLALTAMQGPYGFRAVSTMGRPSGDYVGNYYFSLTQAQQLKVRVADTIVWDNIGGVSLLFTPGVTPPTPGSVPEPASWALLIAGFGLTGAALRRRPAVTV